MTDSSEINRWVRDHVTAATLVVGCPTYGAQAPVETGPNALSSTFRTTAAGIP